MKPLSPCPFCGKEPRVTTRPDNLTGTEFFAAVACYCGGYSACAHKMAIANTQVEACDLAATAWNARKSRDLFNPMKALDSITCLVVDGPEVMPSADIVRRIKAIVDAYATESSKVSGT